MGRAEAAWRYSLTSHTRSWAAAGLALVDSGAPGPAPAGQQPFGVVGVETESGTGWPRFTGGVMAAGAPVEDRLTGTVAQRAELRAWGTWVPSERWTLGASILGARVMSGSAERQAFTAGEFWLNWALRQAILVTTGGRWTTTWPVPVTGSRGLPESQWTAYLSFRGVYRSGDAPVARPAGIPGMGLH
jgi:hypothetical protein